MKRSKKIFLIIAAIFLILMLLIAYDISTRTSWPGADKEENASGEVGWDSRSDEVTESL